MPEHLDEERDRSDEEEEQRGHPDGLGDDERGLQARRRDARDWTTTCPACHKRNAANAMRANTAATFNQSVVERDRRGNRMSMRMWPRLYSADEKPMATMTAIK